MLTILILVLLGILNWVGVSESAKVSLVGALVAFGSDVAILVTVFSHLSFTDVVSLIQKMFATHALTPESFLAGFAGSFLAFSGLESISQLSPVMKQPHKKVAGIALAMVVLTVGLTSPLLTMFSTLLLPREAADPVLSSQLISLLAGKWGGVVLQTEVAVSASALLVFASNTAIIGSYHVFMALARMEFLPDFVLRRNKLRGTPHNAIALATGIPILILLLVLGNINILGDMYAFGLLGAFTLTCLGLDILRFRDWKRTREALGRAVNLSGMSLLHASNSTSQMAHQDEALREEHGGSLHTMVSGNGTGVPVSVGPTAKRTEAKSLWFKIDFFLGVLTTLLVAIAWSTNLVTKPLATLFGGSVAFIGMAVAYVNYVRSEQGGRVPVPVVVSHVEERIPNSVLAVLLSGGKQNAAVIAAAVRSAEAEHPLVFLYLGEDQTRWEAPRMMEIIDPYLDDKQAKEYFGKAESAALKAKVPVRKYVYIRGKPELANRVWQVIHPHDAVIAAEYNEQFKDINPDRVRYEVTPEGKVVHLLKRW